MNREPVLIFTALLTAAQVLVASTYLAELIGPKAAGIAAMIVAAVGAGWGIYTRQKVYPAPAVAAATDPATGDTVAGPAAPTPDGEPVSVLPVPAQEG